MQQSSSIQVQIQELSVHTQTHAEPLPVQSVREPDLLVHHFVELHVERVTETLPVKRIYSPNSMKFSFIELYYGGLKKFHNLSSFLVN